jgi:hypothetical protein
MDAIDEKSFLSEIIRQDEIYFQSKQVPVEEQHPDYQYKLLRQGERNHKAIMELSKECREEWEEDHAVVVEEEPFEPDNYYGLNYIQDVIAVDQFCQDFYVTPEEKLEEKLAKEKWEAEKQVEKDRIARVEQMKLDGVYDTTPGIELNKQIPLTKNWLDKLLDRIRTLEELVEDLADHTNYTRDL